MLWWLSLRPEARPVRATERAVRPYALLAIGVLAMQILLGGWTSTNYAATACPDFPTCQGRLAPAADFGAGFVLWRGLGQDYEGGVLPPAARVAIHWTHRLGAVIAGITLLLLSASALRRGQSRRLKLAAGAVMAAVGLQWLIGMNLIWKGFPLWLGTAHNAGAALLLLSALALLRYLSPVSSSPQVARR